MLDPILDQRESPANGRSWAVMGRSLDPVDTGRRVQGAVPVYGYPRLPGVSPVGVWRTDGHPAGSRDARPRPHAHDFLVLGLVAHGAGVMRLDEREWPLRTGDLFLVAPGEVVDAANLGTEPADVWTAFFPPDAIEPTALRSWRTHPLLFPFVRGPAAGAQRLPVPVADRPRFAGHFAALDLELRGRREGYGEAVLAHLTLLLVDVARIAADVGAGLRLRDEPLLADVFDMVEAEFDRPISLRDVAAAVGLSPGHLTTVVRRKTGRTVQQWITERRMAEARRLLAETDLTVAALAARVGYRDVGYFIRSFRRGHGAAPTQWRRAGRVADPIRVANA